MMFLSQGGIPTSLPVNTDTHWAVYIILALLTLFVGAVATIIYKVAIPYWTERNNIALDAQRAQVEMINSTRKLVDQIGDGQKAMSAMIESIAGRLKDQSATHGELIHEVTELVLAHTDAKVGFRFETESLKKALLEAMQQIREGEEVEKIAKSVEAIIKPYLRGSE